MALKQIRQMPNLRINARGRPQNGQRLYVRTLNFGVRCAFNNKDFFANESSSFTRRVQGISGRKDVLNR
jgi:hypothetical protein